MPHRLVASLEAFEAERANFQRVIDAIHKIKAASVDQLRSVEWLVDLIREVGLVPIPEAERTYGEEADYINASQQGLIQIPREFARYLLLLGEQRISSYLEIGCFNGATASLTAAYLHRFNPDLRAVTIDLFPAFLFYSEVRELIPLRYEVGVTSFHFREKEAFDAVFIDGDHSFEWSWADYQNCGRRAKVCAFHDVNNGPYLELELGGVPAVWEWVMQNEKGAGVEFVELFEHPREALMGIGVRLRK